MKNVKTILLGIIVALFIVLSNESNAQNVTPIKKGFTIGGFAGVGALHFSQGLPEGQSKTSGDISLPNMKIGWFVKDNLAIYLNAVGQTYELNDLDRSFEGYIPSVQYWSDKCWISAGFGPALDTRAFYESSSKSAKSNWGKGVLLSAGYEVKQRQKWAMDIQARLYMASVKLDGGERLDGTNLSVGVGFTLF